MNWHLHGPFPSHIRYERKPEPQWATWIPSRKPDFKPHNTLGQAKNAMLQNYPLATGRAALYEHVDSEWVLRGEYPHKRMRGDEARKLLEEWSSGSSESAAPADH